MKAIDIKHAEIGQVSSRVDGSIRFAVVTPELQLNERAVILGLHGKNVRVMVEPIDVPVDELVNVEADPNAKSKSSRLRAVMFVWWKQKKEGTFNEFYDKKMESIIDKIKESLDPE